jgi:hypothetical protein
MSYELIIKTTFLRLDPYVSKLFSMHKNCFIKKINITDCKWMLRLGVCPPF